jgi:hypothetical protein
VGHRTGTVFCPQRAGPGVTTAVRRPANDIQIRWAKSQSPGKLTPHSINRSTTGGIHEWSQPDGSQPDAEKKAHEEIRQEAVEKKCEAPEENEEQEKVSA